MFTRKQSQQRDEQAIFDYENPPIEAVDSERVLKGIEYVEQRKWTHVKAAEKAGIDRHKLER